MPTHLFLKAGLTTVCVIGALSFSQAHVSTLWGQSGELWSPTSRLPDYSHASYHSGKDPIPDKPIKANVRDFGAVGDGQTDDSQAFIRAIKSITDGAVHIPAGRYKITKQLVLPTNVVLQGAGRDQTTLYFPLPLLSVVGDPASFAPAGSWSWSGGFVVAGGQNSTAALATVTVPTVRGRTSLTVSTTKNLQVGQTLRLALFDTDHSLERHLLADQVDAPSDRSQLVDFSFKITAISGNTLSMDRPLRTDVRLVWTPKLFLDQPTVHDVGIEDLTFEFPPTVYAGHHSEPGYNAIDFETVAHSWIRRLRIINADSGIFIREHSEFCTVQSIDFKATNGRLRLGYGTDGGEPQTVLVGGHHAILVEGVSHDNWITDIHFSYRFIHEFGVSSYASGNVFSNSSGVDMVLDQHRRAPYENLFTDIDAGVGTRLWQAGGDDVDGPPAGARETFWNVRTSQAQTLPDWALEMNVIGITTVASNQTSATGNWWEAIGPNELAPSDLFLAQNHQTSTPTAPNPLAGSAGLATPKVFPNPWRADKHSSYPQIMFGSLSADSTVKLFTLSGRFIKSLTVLSGSATWDLTNESGARVGSGLYIYTVTNGSGKTVRGQVGVVR